MQNTLNNLITSWYRRCKKTIEIIYFVASTMQNTLDNLADQPGSRRYVYYYAKRSHSSSTAGTRRGQVLQAADMLAQHRTLMGPVRSVRDTDDGRTLTNYLPSSSRDLYPSVSTDKKITRPDQECLTFARTSWERRARMKFAKDTVHIQISSRNL